MSPTDLLNCIGGDKKSAKFGLNFRPQSPMTRSDVETEHYIGDLKRPPVSPMIVRELFNYSKIWYKV